MSETQDEAGGYGPSFRFGEVGHILDDKYNVVELTGPDAQRQAWEWRVKNPDKCRVAYTAYDAEAFISTVFLTLDHAFGGGKPILFESMVFGVSVMEDFQARYHTWAEAEQGHAAIERTVELLGYYRLTEEARAAQVKMLDQKASYEARAMAKRLEFERTFGKGKRIIKVKKP